MNEELKDKLEQERVELQAQMLSLECSDDRLFSNSNGNLPTWKAYRDRIRRIDEILKSA
jgi:hypothetical protein